MSCSSLLGTTLSWNHWGAKESPCALYKPLQRGHIEKCPGAKHFTPAVFTASMSDCHLLRFKERMANVNTSCL